MHIVLSPTCTYYGIDLILRLLHPPAPMTHFGGNLHPVCGRYCFSYREKSDLVFTQEYFSEQKLFFELGALKCESLILGPMRIAISLSDIKNML